MQNANRMSDATVYCRIFDTHTEFIQINEKSDTALALNSHHTNIYAFHFIGGVSSLFVRTIHA